MASTKKVTKASPETAPKIAAKAQAESKAKTAKAAENKAEKAKPVKAAAEKSDSRPVSAKAKSPVLAEKPAAKTADPARKAAAAKILAMSPATAAMKNEPTKTSTTQKTQENAAAAPSAAPKNPAAQAPALQTSSTSDRTQVTEKKIDSAAAPKTKVETAKPTAAKPSKPTNQRQGFKTNEFIVYPAHGVGQIVGIEEQEVAGFKLELFVISFAKDKMTLKVPTPKVVSVGMRKLAEPPIVKRALETLKGRARVKRTMWSRRAQEYEAKINSGDLVAIAEVVRDLYRSDAQPEQSYSERQLYEAALDRVARELSAVQKLTETEALKLIEGQLQKGPKRGAKVEAAEGEAEDGDVEEAA